jgi:UDP-N-acetylmuramate-alanine ligase
MMNFGNTIQDYRHQNTLVLVMGAGAIDGWVRTRLEATRL